jgi:hypothetical protein
LNFNAENYIELINWIDLTVTATSLLSKIPVDEISSIIFGGNSDSLPFVHVPCHTQAVERGVKMVTEARQEVCGEIARNG